MNPQNSASGSFGRRLPLHGSVHRYGDEWVIGRVISKQGRTRYIVRWFPDRNREYEVTTYEDTEEIHRKTNKVET